MKITLDYASPEKTCQDIVTAGENLSGELYVAMIDQSAAELALAKCRSDIGMSIRNSGVKVTEGYIESALDGNGEVSELQSRVDKAKARVAGIRASLENVDRAYGLFKTWMQGQRPIGLNDR